ncbi:MAG TPA: acyltransferase, partial [Actinopolymorphaceae bacterium]
MEPPGEFDYCPWLFWRAPDDVREAHAAWLDTLRERLQANEGELEVGDRVYISPLAAVFPRRLRMGDRCYIAAHAYVTEDVVTGDDCTLNPFVTVRGKVELGDAVRIGAHTSILGFNHGTDPDRPVHRQPLTSRGIRIGDDVWIGSNAVVLDGVTIGDHCVIGAGAVVTRDLPAWSIAAGNPARVIRDRRDDRRQGRRNDDLAVRLAEFAERAREQATAVLERCRRAPGSAPDLPGGTAFVPVPGG